MEGLLFLELSLYALMGVGLVGLFLEGRDPEFLPCLIIAALWPAVLALWGAFTLFHWIKKRIAP